MNAPKFTPGPWSLRPVSDPTQKVILIQSQDNVIARLLDDGPEDRANAVLLLLAPQMYATLERAAPLLESYARITGYGNPGDVAQICRDILAKAVRS